MGIQKKSKWQWMALLIALMALVWATACEEKQTAERPVVDPDKPDIVVVGSEIEGMYLARAAMEEGLAVLVLDPREQPGGQLIQGEMLYLDETFADGGKSLLQGKVKELFTAYKKGDIRKPQQFQAYFRDLTDGIPILSGIAITGIDIADDLDAAKPSKRIRSLSYKTKDGQQKTVTAKYFVDNTDFAAVTSKLGLTRIPGIETVFTSTRARDHMAASLMMKFRGVDWDKFRKEIGKLSRKEVEEKYGSETTVTDMFTWGFGNVGARFQPSSDDIFLRGLNTVNQGDGEVLINALLVYGIDPADDASVRRAVEMGKRETERILPHLRAELPGWENAELNGFPNYLYIRDYDRYETEYVLQATDLMSGSMYWDNVSIAGYPLDLQGTLEHRWGERKGVPDKYGMPLRSFIPKGYSNVIVAGKNVGASAVAFGSARIQPNTSIAGEVIGIILGQTWDRHSIAELTEKDMKKLHDYILKKADIRLSGVTAKNKIANLTDEQKQQLNAGKLTLP